MPGHCGYADAQIAAVLTALQTRLDRGHWGDVAQPTALNASATRIAAASGLERGDAPFIRYTPDRMLRFRTRGSLMTALEDGRRSPP